MVLVGISVGCLMGCFRAPRPWRKTAPLKRPINWVLPEDYCKKSPCNFNTEMFVSKVGNPCPTLGQLLPSRILYVLLAGEKQYEITRARFCTRSCSEVGQLLVNSSPTPHPMGSCRGLPCSSPLATPELRGLWKKTKEPREVICVLVLKRSIGGSFT